MTVRVRFSAASCGLSLAGARVALYSWLYARHEGGTLVLCVEDVAPSRPVAPGAGSLCDDMRWLGLDWDEGPCLRSERTKGYKECAQQLLDRGAATASAFAPGPGDPSPSHERIRLGAPPREQYTIVDLVQGTQVVQARSAEAPTLFATEGPPSPSLAAVADDHELGITHVIQAHERWPELFTYLHLCEVLGWRPPRFAHLPALSFDDTSARPSSLQSCREQGYLGLAVANDLCRMGWTPRGRRELLPPTELAARFDLSRVARGPYTPAPRQLEWLNRRCLAQLDPTQRTGLMVDRWQRAYGLADRSQGTGLTPAAWRQMLADAVSGQVHALAEVPDQVRFAFVDQVDPDPQAAQALSRLYAGQVLEAFVEGLSTVEPFAYEEMDAMISELRWHFKAVLGVRSRDVLHVVRAALTGRVDAPCLVVACQLLGRTRCLQRAQHKLQRAQQGRQRAQQKLQRIGE
ncbi:MAG TPA: glutamate--tRNA ligase family protein [Anaerolineae bacterium]|nr:glutamate--tRNA ligase family protein [Anaerolineae bacterium]